MHVPVVIVGAGPVGLALAGDLAWQGVPSLLLERSDGSIYQPKMDLVGIRTMEFCRRWGITQWVEASPYPRDYPQDNVYVTSLAGYELGRERVPTLDEAVPPPQSPARRERCPQDMFDPILRRFVTSFAATDLRYEHEWLGFTQDADGVTSSVRGPDGEFEVTSDYLVGCDGAASAVRHAIGVGMSGRGVLTHTTNVVFRCDELEPLRGRQLGYRYIFIGPEGTWATLVAINGRDRWRFSLVGDETPREWSEEDIHAAIRRAVGVECEYEIESVLPWIRRELVADGYRQARVFIAGDAAHLTSPTGGLGMNTGIGDAVDLSWKLAGALAGWGGEQLLASYEIERRPVAVRIGAESTENLKAMMSPKDVATPLMLDPTAEGGRHRKEVGERFSDAMRREWFSLGLHLGLRYECSPVIVDEQSPAEPTEVGRYIQSARPGGRAPHEWLPDGRSTLDLFGRGFVLLRVGADAPSFDALMVEARRRAIPVRSFRLLDSHRFGSYSRKLVLVRPDGYVAWWSDTPATDVSGLLDHVTGCLVSAPVGASERMSGS